jgi:hypothetical protein
MTLVKMGKHEAVFRVDITTCDSTTTHFLLAVDPPQAANRAAKEAGLDRQRRYAIEGMRIERLTNRLPPTEACREFQRLSGQRDGQSGGPSSLVSSAE